MIRVVLARGGRQLGRCRRGVRPFYHGRGCAKRSQKNKLTALPGSTRRQALFSLFAAQTSAVGSPQGATDVARDRLGALFLPHSSSRMHAPAPVLPMPLTSHAWHVCSCTARWWWPAAFSTSSKDACEPFNPRLVFLHRLCILRLILCSKQRASSRVVVLIECHLSAIGRIIGLLLPVDRRMKRYAYA